MYTTEQLRRVASHWHGGQFTAMYAFASSGSILSPVSLMHEAEQCIEDAKKIVAVKSLENWREYEKDISALKDIVDMCQRHIATTSTDEYSANHS